MIIEFATYYIRSCRVGCVHIIHRDVVGYFLESIINQASPGLGQLAKYAIKPPD